MDPESWYALQIRHNCERITEIGLRGKGYEVFLPVYQKQMRSGCRSIGNECPLFPGYLFCRVKPECNGHIVTTPGVIRIVSFGGQPAIIDDRELTNIRTIIDSEVLCEPWQYLSVGCTVEIRNGPLKGLDGILVSAKRSQKIVVSVGLLQRSVAATLDADTTVAVILPNRPDRDSVKASASLLREVVTATALGSVNRPSTR